jgi:DNA-binding response OmpR family regulator
MEHLSTPNRRQTILLVEDDQELALLIQEYLIKNGFEVEVVGDGIAAISRIFDRPLDLVILDVMLPGQSGMDVLKEVRPAFKEPILMLTALDEDMDQMLGLELGADDYVIKPIKPRLLLSRVRALLRRSDRALATGIAEPSPSIERAISRQQETVIPLQLKLSSREVFVQGESVSLTTAEYDLLHLLAENQGQVVSRDTIVQSLRGFDYDGLDRSIDRRISRLRKKLNDDPVEPTIIKTVRGKGYLLCLSVVH